MAKERFAFERLDFNAARKKLTEEETRLTKKDNDWRDKISRSKTIKENTDLVNQGLDILNKYTDDVVGVAQDYKELKISLSAVQAQLNQDRNNLTLINREIELAGKKTLLDESRAWRKKTKKMLSNDDYWEYLRLCMIKEHIDNVASEIAERRKALDAQINKDRENQPLDIFGMIKSLIVDDKVYEKYEAYDQDFANKLKEYSVYYREFYNELLEEINKLTDQFRDRPESKISRPSTFYQKHNETILKLDAKEIFKKPFDELNKIKGEWDKRADFALFTSVELNDYYAALVRTREYLDTIVKSMIDKTSSRDKLHWLVDILDKNISQYHIRDLLRKIKEELKPTKLEMATWEHVIQHYQDLSMKESQIVAEMYHRLNLSAKNREIPEYTDSVTDTFKRMRRSGAPLVVIEESGAPKVEVKGMEIEAVGGKKLIAPRADLNGMLILKFKENIEGYVKRYGDIVQEDKSYKKKSKHRTESERRQVVDAYASAVHYRNHMPGLPYFKVPDSWSKFTPKTTEEIELYNNPDVKLLLNMFEDAFRHANRSIVNLIKGQTLLNNIDEHGIPVWMVPLKKQLDFVTQHMQTYNGDTEFIVHVNSEINELNEKYSQKIRELASSAKDEIKILIDNTIQYLAMDHNPISKDAYVRLMKKINSVSLLIKNNIDPNYDAEAEFKAAYGRYLAEKIKARKLDNIDKNNAIIIFAGLDADPNHVKQLKELLGNAAGNISEYINKKGENAGIADFVKDLIIVKPPITKQLDESKNKDRLLDVANTYVAYSRDVNNRPKLQIPEADVKKFQKGSNTNTQIIKVPDIVKGFYTPPVDDGSWRASFFTGKKDLIQHINQYAQFVNCINEDGYLGLENSDINTSLEIMENLSMLLESEKEKDKEHWEGFGGWIAKKFTHDKTYEMQQVWKKHIIELKQQLGKTRNEILNRVFDIKAMWKYVSYQDRLGKQVIDYRRVNIVRRNVQILIVNEKDPVQKLKYAKALEEFNEKCLNEDILIQINRAILADLPGKSDERDYLKHKLNNTLKYMKEFYSDDLKKDSVKNKMGGIIESGIQAIIKHTGDFSELARDRVELFEILLDHIPPENLSKYVTDNHIANIQNEIRSYLDDKKRLIESEENETLNRVISRFIIIFPENERSKLDEQIKEINRIRMSLANDISNADHVMTALEFGFYDIAGSSIINNSTSNQSASDWEKVRDLIIQDIAEKHPGITITDKKYVEGTSLFQRVVGDRIEARIKELISDETVESVKALKGMISAPTLLPSLGQAFYPRLKKMAESWIASNMVQNVIQDKSYVLTEEDILLLRSVAQSEYGPGSKKEFGVRFWHESNDQNLTEIRKQIYSTDSSFINTPESKITDSQIQIIAALARFNDTSPEWKDLIDHLSNLRWKFQSESASSPNIKKYFNSMSYKLDLALINEVINRAPEKYIDEIKKIIMTSPWNPAFAHIVEKVFDDDEIEEYRLKRIQELYNSVDDTNTSTIEKLNELRSIIELHSREMPASESDTPEADDGDVELSIIKLNQTPIVTSADGISKLNAIIYPDNTDQQRWLASREALIANLETDPDKRLRELQKIRYRWLTDVLTGKETETEPELRNRLDQFKVNTTGTQDNNIKNAFIDYIGEENLQKLIEIIQSLLTETKEAAIKPIKPEDFLTAEGHADVNQVQTASDEIKSLIQRIGITGESIVSILGEMPKSDVAVSALNLDVIQEPIVLQTKESVAEIKAAVDMKAMVKSVYTGLQHNEFEKILERIKGFQSEIMLPIKERQVNFKDSYDYDYASKPAVFLEHFNLPCIDICKLYVDQLLADNNYECLIELRDSGIIETLNEIDPRIKDNDSVEVKQLVEQTEKSGAQLKRYLNSLIISHQISESINEIVNGFTTATATANTNTLREGYNRLNELLRSNSDYIFILKSDLREQLLGNLKNLRSKKSISYHEYVDSISRDLENIIELSISLPNSSDYEKLVKPEFNKPLEQISKNLNDYETLSKINEKLAFVLGGKRSDGIVIKSQSLQNILGREDLKDKQVSNDISNPLYRKYWEDKINQLIESYKEAQKDKYASENKDNMLSNRFEIIYSESEFIQALIEEIGNEEQIFKFNQLRSNDSLLDLLHEISGLLQLDDRSKSIKIVIESIAKRLSATNYLVDAASAEPKEQHNFREHFDRLWMASADKLINGNFSNQDELDLLQNLTLIISRSGELYTPQHRNFLLDKISRTLQLYLSEDFINTTWPHMSPSSIKAVIENIHQFIISTEDPRQLLKQSLIYMNLNRLIQDGDVTINDKMKIESIPGDKITMANNFVDMLLSYKLQQSSLLSGQEKDDKFFEDYAEIMCYAINNCDQTKLDKLAKSSSVIEKIIDALLATTIKAAFDVNKPRRLIERGFFNILEDDHAVLPKDIKIQFDLVTKYGTPLQKIELFYQLDKMRINFELPKYGAIYRQDFLTAITGSPDTQRQYNYIRTGFLKVYNQLGESDKQKYIEKYNNLEKTVTAKVEPTKSDSPYKYYQRGR